MRVIVSKLCLPTGFEIHTFHLIDSALKKSRTIDATNYPSEIVTLKM